MNEVATAVAAPVLRWLERPRQGRVLGAGPEAAYIDAGGFVVAVTAHGVPLMPNGVALGAPPAAPAAFGRGAAVRLRRGAIESRAAAVRWAAAGSRVCDPRVSRLNAAELARVAARIDAAGPTEPDPAVREPFRRLTAALEARSDDWMGSAAAALVGLGPGLTPEGDDLLAGILATLAAAGRRRPDLLPGDLRRRTTALSATLLELAAEGRIMEPAAELLRHGHREGADAGTVSRLLRVGHSTGHAYALGIAATAALLGITAKTREVGIACAS